MSTYYVSTSGNDNNDGSQASPWRHIAYGASRLSAGDTLFCLSGVYPETIGFEGIAGGTSWSNKVRIAAYPGHSVTMRPSGGGHVLGFAGQQRYIEFDGINLDGRFVSFDVVKIYDGGDLNNRAHHIRLQNLEIIRGAGQSGDRAMNIMCVGLSASALGGNEFINLTVHGGGLSDFDNSIYLESPNNLVDRCLIYDGVGAGVQVYNANGRHIPSNNTIRNTIIRDFTRITNERGDGVILGGGLGNKVYNTVIYNIRPNASGSAAIHVFDADNSEIYNNTVYGNVPPGILVESFSFGTKVRNNISYKNPAGNYVNNGSGTSASHNITDGTDPRFVSENGRDFHLLDTSPAIDAGLTISLVATDVDGGARPAGAAYDIGAYEFGSEGGAPPPEGSPPETPAPGSPDLTGSPSDVIEPGPSPIPPSGTSTALEFYSDHDMQDPPNYYGGFKEGRIRHAGEGTRNFSDMFTGEWSGATFDLSLSDFDRKFRQQLNSVTDRNWVEPLQIWMTTRANRALLGTMYTVFVGPIIDIGEMQSSDPLTLDLTLGDIISEALLSDDYQLPWRVIRDGFIGELDEVAEALDLDAPEPIIYGQHRRVPDVDPASPQGFQVTPIYLGIEGLYHVWMVCGHACADIPEVLVWTPDEFGGLGTSASVLADSDWLIPHTSAPAYEDRHSVTYGNDRRYTLIRGLVGTEEEPTDADACAIGDKTLTCFVDGVEPVGDGSGAVITDRFQQYKHFLINFVANRGQASYQSGAWLENPVWDLFDGPVTIIEEDSFDTASAIAEERLPLPDIGSPGPDYAAGYIGAAIIGARASDRASVRRWIAEWNRSCGCSFGPTHFGQIRVSLLHPTAEIKAAATLYTDAYEILQGSFGTRIPWREKVNRVPWRADYEYTSGQWKTSDVASIDAGITQYGRELLGAIREYPFAPGETAANHLAQLEAKIRVQPLRIITLEATIGHDDQGDSLGYRDLGDYVRYKHFDAVSASKSQDRLAYVIGHQVQAGKRRVRITALDVEDLIGFDAFEAPGESPGNETCATAVVIPTAEIVNYTTQIDTTLHAEDPTIDGLCGSPAGAFHAAWFEYTPTQAQKGHVTTGTSGYDTILGVFTGDCGSLVLEECNDNDGLFTTSFIEFGDSNFLLPGVTYRFLVTGRTPADGGKLVFTLFLEPL